MLKYGKPNKFSSARNINFTLLSGAFCEHLVMMNGDKMMFPEV